MSRVVRTRFERDSDKPKRCGGKCFHHYCDYMSNQTIAQIVLSSPMFINKSNQYKFIKPWLEEGLLISDSSKWYQRRKIITPAFHLQILEQFVEIFDRQSTIMMDTLSKFKAEDCVELYPMCTLYALDVICGK